MVLSAATYKFSVDEYNRMADYGILHEDDRVELIEGEIVCMALIGNRHYNTVNRLNAAFAPLAVARSAITHVQNPVVLNDRTKPQPDVVLLRYTADFYSGREVTASDALLVVEVADTSLDYDRLTKVPLYASAGIAEVWLVDLTQNQVEVYRAPSGGAFSDQRIYARGAVLSPLAFPDLQLKVQDILG
jgi:Uma2 family endonuclease